MFPCLSGQNQNCPHYFHVMEKWVRTSSSNLFSKSLSIGSFIEESGLTGWSGSSWEEPDWYQDGLNLTCVKTHTRGETGGMSVSHSDWTSPWRPRGSLRCVCAHYWCCPRLPVWPVMLRTAPAAMSTGTRPAQRRDTRRLEQVDTKLSPSPLYQLWAGSGTMLRPPTWWPSGSWSDGSANWVSPDLSVHHHHVHQLSVLRLSVHQLSVHYLIGISTNPVNERFPRT